MALLQDLSQEALIARVNAAEAALALANKPRKLTLKVGKAGGISLYGMGKYPTTLYASQWERVIAHVDEIKDFIQANAAVLTRKA